MPDESQESLGIHTRGTLIVRYFRLLHSLGPVQDDDAPASSLLHAACCIAERRSMFDKFSDSLAGQLRRRGLRGVQDHVALSLKGQ